MFTKLMINRAVSIHGIAAAVCLFGALVLFQGCKKTASTEVPGSSQGESEPATLVEYTVRGRIQQLPGGPEFPAREFIVRHEAIPEFRSSMAPGDERMGMQSMAMAFPLGEGVSLEGFAVGDLVEMMFEASYDGDTGRLQHYQVRTIAAIDPATKLDIIDPTPRLP